jgi:zona occludens toxin (predicted ATPase)
MDLNPAMLMDYSRKFFAGKTVKEGQITLVIDEAQMLFNARSWDKADRDGWNKFFQIHRHFGYDVILVAQFDRMIDRQIRSLIEYEHIHRKVSNFGAKGKLLCVLMLAPNLFVDVKMWYPMKERIGSEFFRASKKLYRLYDTYLLFDN